MHEELKHIAELMKSQNNRCTHLPIFIVVEDKKIYGVDSNFDCDGRERKDYDSIDRRHDLCDDCKELLEKGEELPDDCDDCSEDAFVNFRIEKDVPNMRAAFFLTEEACDRHIIAQGHHYNETARSYAISACYNYELENVMNYVKDYTPEIVICAAVKCADRIVRGHRHANCIDTAHRMGLDTSHMSEDEGFITSRNRFVSRVEGYNIQVAAGIHSVLEGTEHADGVYLHGELYSEDLY
jgi:hypothetical protein